MVGFGAVGVRFMGYIIVQYKYTIILKVKKRKDGFTRMIYSEGVGRILI